MREPDRRCGSRFEILGVEDHEVGGLLCRIDDEVEEPSLVLVGIGRLRDEHELAGQMRITEVVHAAGARFEVMLVQLRGARQLRVAVGRDGHRVDVAMALAKAPLVDPGELLRGRIHHLAADAACHRIQANR